MDFIPYGTQLIEDDDIAAVVEVLKSGFLTTGPKIAEFENALCGVTGDAQAVAVSNGTAALHLAMLAAGVSEGDEVLLSPITFAASANAALYVGAKPVFVDVDEASLLMDIADVKAKLTPKTKAVVAVHFGGEVCDLHSLSEITRASGSVLIQDCAHSLGSRYGGKQLGEFDGLRTWSFHPVKTITTGEGGAVTTNDDSFADRLRLLRTHGITRDPALLENPEVGAWYYEMKALGYNYRMTDIQCALGISQLKKLARFAERRAEIVAYYDESFRGLPLKVQSAPAHSEAARHLYTIRLDEKGRRREIFDALTAKGIGANVHYIPVYLLPYYRSLGYKKGLCPVAEDAYERLITIPLYAGMTDPQAEYVVKTIAELLG